MNAALSQDLIARICSVVKPEAIYLFGSAARLEERPDSDIDVCVIIPDHLNSREISRSIYLAMYGFSKPVDVITVTQEKWSELKETPGLIYSRINREKIELYAA